MAEGIVSRKVKVEGGNLKFSAAHFITFGGKCERLHGHNYGVLVEMEGTLNEDKLVFDFTIIKRLTREICQRFNHRFLLPMHNPHLQLGELADAWEVRFGEKRYVFPRTDVVELPIDNSTSERLAEYMCGVGLLLITPRICIRLWLELKKLRRKWLIIARHCRSQIERSSEV